MPIGEEQALPAWTEELPWKSVGRKDIVSYLGYPFSPDAPRAQLWEKILSAIQLRLLSWEDKLLSFEGHVVLLRAILSAIPQYVLAFLPLRQEQLRLLHRLYSNFLWEVAEDGRPKRHLLRWDVVQQPTWSGGTGFSAGVADRQQAVELAVGHRHMEKVVEDSVFRMVLASRSDLAMEAHILSILLGSSQSFLTFSLYSMRCLRCRTENCISHLLYLPAVGESVVQIGAVVSIIAAVLAVSRVMVAWQPTGIAMGVYDVCHRYLKERKQFGAPLTAFQLNQGKLVRMLGHIQSMWLMGWRLCKLYDAGKMTPGHASLTKAHNTKVAREVCALGRELVGGNGILSDFNVAKAFCDLEPIYTYEGTYEVNSLVTAREVTGIASIKPPVSSRTKRS
ncbi:hypothetical protein R1sor_001753 [Riccia sorocarpa]|uniref:Acyl-CoA dehydrogenase/oxidase C-terminal domain-containing protein n=1 Tax=Riccia sorocarpa TaxID=122646 RepID=A0ABD3GYT4_9MARC